MKKNNKTTGFTLIELLVVISIIALLSSIVLASVKTAREKADGARIVAEMKSLQVALELYKSKFGVYPDVGVDEDQSFLSSYAYSGFNDFVKTSLVNNKFISKVPQSKGYPNNCIDNNCDNGNMFLYFGPSYIPNTSNSYYKCGGQKVINYILIYLADEKLKLKLPNFEHYYYGNTYYESADITGMMDIPATHYCLSI